MDLYASPGHYLFNLDTLQTSEARRLWRQAIKDKWEYKCAYCGSKHKITIDHIIPQCKGGSDFVTNVVACCESCNRSKSHHDWLEWYSQQEFFDENKKQSIIEWMGFESETKQKLFSYGRRKNTVY